MKRDKITIRTLRRMKTQHEKITMLTAYDYPMARAVDEAGIDVILVGDSVGMVVLGYPTTLPVTMDDMLHHCKSVARGVSRALLVGDLPFMSYQVSREDALRNAGRLVKEGGAEAVKLEGGQEVLGAVEAMVAAGIPVMGHLGLTPQSYHQMGGYRIQGRTAEAADRLLKDAAALERAGVFSVVLEGIPAEVARRVTEGITVPTIGIGAGPSCDGQVLVTHDMLGLHEDLSPKFVKRYAQGRQLFLEAMRQFRNEVRSGAFPGAEHSYNLEAAPPGATPGT
ncbi:MAG TPA: 3-methyl-2-oxobutanoate hydroxymethyltransferase [Candidatus Methylomirabilis sp.]|nr:3-methyl-2-oxobutanoate hydroxymethyltransferase [Candidatus Methylomirabilis sp.]